MHFTCVLVKFINVNIVFRISLSQQDYYSLIMFGDRYLNYYKLLYVRLSTLSLLYVISNKKQRFLVQSLNLIKTLSFSQGNQALKRGFSYYYIIVRVVRMKFSDEYLIIFISIKDDDAKREICLVWSKVWNQLKMTKGNRNC